MGTVVVEAAPKSGSLITARHAADYGREVMAVPGSPLDPRAQGCNLLIREGATLVQGAEDVLEAIRPLRLGPLPGRVREDAAPAPSADADEAARRLIGDLLGPTPVVVDEIVRPVGTGAGHRPDGAARAGARRPARAPCRRQGQPGMKGGSVRVARRVFAIAGIYGLIVLLPLYFAEPLLAARRP
jgi:hypothetical protein